MSEFFSSVTLIPALSLVLLVILLTVSAALLWEGARRFLKSRAAGQALKNVAQRDEEIRGTGKSLPRSSILNEAGDGSLPAWLEPILLRLPHRDDLQRLLDRGASSWSVPTVIMLSVGVAVGVGLFSSIFVSVSIVPIFLGLIGAYIPIGYLQFRAARRMRAFEENFGEAIDLLARAARAGHSLPTGLEVVADEAEEPVAGEFRQVYEEQRFGLPMNDALLGLADRVDLIDVRIFVTAVMIQRESGGNLAENLDSLSHVIRGRFRFKRDVKTKTAHGRMTGMVVGLAPFVAGIAMYTLNPEYMAPLFEEPMGQMMLMGGGAMMLMGFYIIRRITDVKV